MLINVSSRTFSFLAADMVSSCIASPSYPDGIPKWRYWSPQWSPSHLYAYKKTKCWSSFGYRSSSSRLSPLYWETQCVWSVPPTACRLCLLIPLLPAPGNHPVFWLCGRDGINVLTCQLLSLPQYILLLSRDCTLWLEFESICQSASEPLRLL